MTNGRPIAPRPNPAELNEEIAQTRLHIGEALDAIGRIFAPPGTPAAGRLPAPRWAQHDELVGAAAATLVAARHVVPLVRATFSRKALLGVTIVALGAMTLGALVAGRGATAPRRAGGPTPHGRFHAAR